MSPVLDHSMQDNLRATNVLVFLVNGQVKRLQTLQHLVRKAHARYSTANAYYFDRRSDLRVVVVFDLVLGRAVPQLL